MDRLNLDLPFSSTHVELKVILHFADSDNAINPQNHPVVQNHLGPMLVSVND